MLNTLAERNIRWLEDILRRTQQKVALEPGRLMAGNEVQKPAAGFHVNPALKENEMCREISVIN